ncbi:MAG: xanthine dehydrogenase family protein [Bacteriovoracaceae bacterium]|jgi:CO/xanthine dehydrogenase Mo-binding subunit|nr:xanthine dehydrogenase family protein [Bacteriovoracaceae bacterium]
MKKRSFPTRVEGVSKLTGKSKYIDDLKFPNMLHGVSVRSSVPRGKIKGVSFKPGIDWEKFTIVRASDIPGKNVIQVILDDQPCLASSHISHPGEVVLLLAGEDREEVLKARDYVELDIEASPGIFSIEDSLAKKEVVWGSDNIFKEYTITKGDVAKGISAGSQVIEGSYSTGAQEQLYIENHGVIAHASDDGSITVWGSLQCPYYVQQALREVFSLPPEKVRVVQTETGGGFGGKEDYPSIISSHAALLSYKSKRPVKMIYSRAEDMEVTTKRHPSMSHIKMAVDKKGKITGLDFEFFLDGGAYATLSSVVLSRGTIHAAGPYNIENVRVHSKAVATNHPPFGAFRGFGAPQSIFALERHMDVVAKKLGIDPVEFRKINVLKIGDTTATGQSIAEEPGYHELFSTVDELMDFSEKSKSFAIQNKKNPIVKKGIGLACFFHGAGFTGSGESYLASIVGLEATRDGQVVVKASSTEIGQGANTIFSQVASSALGISEQSVIVARPDTSNVPNSGPTVASRTTMVVGDLLEKAGSSLVSTLRTTGFLGEVYTEREFFEASGKYIDQFGSLKSYVQYKQPPGIKWDEENYQGDAYATYAWAVYAAEVSVNTLTYETKVDDFVAIQEVGHVMHPTLAEGQIEGGVAQGVGYALSEKVVWEEGLMKNSQMTNYIMHTSADVPDIRVYFEEKNQNYGPKGAKGIGELPMDGPAPAIINAVQNALGSAPHFIPMLPEDLMEFMEASSES